MCPAILQGWKVMGSTPVGGSENSFSEYFDLRTLLHYLHFIQVTNPFIICFILVYNGLSNTRCTYGHANTGSTVVLKQCPVNQQRSLFFFRGSKELEKTMVCARSH